MITVPTVKVNLIWEDSEGRNGYRNILVKGSRGEFSNAIDALDDGECSEIVAHNILNRFQFSHLDDILGMIVRKMAREGTLYMIVPDLNEICRAVRDGSLNVKDANKLLYGENDYRSATSLIELCAKISTYGLTTIRRRVENKFEAVIVCQRP